MIDAIRAAFPQADLNQFLQTLTDVKFCIYDTDEKFCKIQADPDGEVHFTVLNPAGRPIHFLAIDRGIIPASNNTKRCDCAVFDAKTFCFVEIKVVDSTLQRSEANRRAKEQLKLTVLLFRDKLTFTTKRIEAYVCVGRTVPRPARRATDLNELVEFEDELGVALYYGNEKRFA